ncbi:MAG: AbrB/MazE/SpoVT family DNA-binding domain-containing protein [archaeon]
MTELTTMSSKGQIVVPKDIRKGMQLDPGTTFAIFGKDDTIVLRKVNIPDAKEMFEKVHKWGVEFAKAKGIKESDIERIIHKGRGMNRD